jgi:hypothetical protein
MPFTGSDICKVCENLFRVSRFYPDFSRAYAVLLPV